MDTVPVGVPAPVPANAAAVAVVAKPRRNQPLFVIATVAVIFLLYFGAPFFIPLLVALLIAFVLTPVVDLFTRLVRIRAVAAGIVVISILGIMGSASWVWSDDAVAIWDKAPVAAKSISKSLQRMLAHKSSAPSPMTEMKKAAEEVENVAQGGPASPRRAAVANAPSPSMSVWQVMWAGGKGVGIALSQVLVVTFLVFFMLSSGNLFKRKIVVLSGERLTQRKVTVEMLGEIDKQIRRYLMVLVVSNLLVGSGTWLVFHYFGLEYAGLWGFSAAVLHTIPYFGSALIAVGSLVVAFVQFDDWGQAFVVAGSSVVVATLVGNVFSTWLASRQSKMNATATFIGLLFFGWLWGLWGLLLGIPILAIVKTICDHHDGWKPVSELLGQ